MTSKSLWGAVAAVGVVGACVCGCAGPTGPPPGEGSYARPAPAPEPAPPPRLPAAPRPAAPARVAAVAPTTAPSPVPQPLPPTRPAAETRPVAAAPPATRAAASTTQPTTGPASAAGDHPDEVRAERRALTETFEQLDLLHREVAELQLDPDERREVDALFAQASAAWAAVRAQLDAGRLPPADRRTALTRLARDTESKVTTLIGPERRIQLAGYRQTPRGGGQRFVARLRVAIDALPDQHLALTPAQSQGVTTLLQDLRRSVGEFPAQEAPTFEAEHAVRLRVQALVEDTRTRLAAVLTPAQMSYLARQVPSLAKATSPTTAPATRGASTRMENGG